MQPQKNPARRRVIAGTTGATLAMSLGYVHHVSHRRGHSLSDALLRMALRGVWREARATAKDARVRARDFASRR